MTFGDRWCDVTVRSCQFHVNFMATTFVINIRQNLKSAQLIVVCKQEFRVCKNLYIPFFFQELSQLGLLWLLKVIIIKTRNRKLMSNGDLAMFFIWVRVTMWRYWETWKRCGQNVMFLACPSSNKKIYADMKFPLREAKLFTK